MGKIVIATFGSLGDLHPKIALALELKRREHEVAIAAMDYYREKVEMLGFRFFPMAPHLNTDDRDLAKELMDPNTGTERILKDLIIANVAEMYDDIMAAIDGAEVLITGEVVYAAKSVVEKTGINWVTTTLAPISFMSAYDPPVPPVAPWFEKLRFLGPVFHRAMLKLARRNLREWYEPYKEFRRRLDLDENHDPIFDGKYSNDLHLILFSRVLGKPQQDWPKHAIQTGFCFYDGQEDSGKMPDELTKFLDSGEAPIVFTLGSAAVMDAGNFFDESVPAAKMLGRRAVLLYGVDNQQPNGLEESIIGFEYAPYSLVFPRAACVVHQGGAGTTGQVLRAGVPHLIMPYGHDQLDNAARCRRAGVAEIITRKNYCAETAAQMLSKILGDRRYAENATAAAKIVAAEGGTIAACDAIESVLRK